MGLALLRYIQLTLLVQGICLRNVVAQYICCTLNIWYSIFFSFLKDRKEKRTEATENIYKQNVLHYPGCEK